MLVRKFLFLQLIAVAVFITGCNMPDSRFASDDECRFPSAPEHEAPGWVCGYSVPGLAMQATGQVEISSADINMATRRRAYGFGLANLAEQFAVEVEALRQDFVNTTGKEAAETVDAVSRRIGEEEVAFYHKILREGRNKLTIVHQRLAGPHRIREVAFHQELDGVSQVRSVVNPEGKTLYVLVGIKEERDVEKNLIEIGRKAAEHREFSDSINNERAAWQRYLAEKARDGRCYFSGTKALAPGWVCGKKPDGVAVMGVGQSGPTSTGISFDRREANNIAYEEVAMDIVNRVFDIYVSFKYFVGPYHYFYSDGTVEIDEIGYIIDTDDVAVFEAIVDIVSQMRLEGVEVVSVIDHPKTDEVFALAVIKEQAKVNAAIDNVAKKLTHNTYFWTGLSSVAKKLADNSYFRGYSPGTQEATWQRFLANQARERLSKK